MAVLPPELWPPVIHGAASSLPDLARLSALTRATRALCWTSLSARFKFFKSTLADGQRPIDIFARDPSVLKNPRAFPDLPKFLALLFSDEVPRKHRRRRHDNYYDEDSDDYDYGYQEGDSRHNEGLLERICSVDGDENESWVRACIQAWPIDIEGLTAPTDEWFRRSHKQRYFDQAVVNLLCRGRVGLLSMMIGDVTGVAAIKAVMNETGVSEIIRESRDPMPVLVELLYRSGVKLPVGCWPGAIGVAAARGSVDVIKFLSGLSPGLYNTPGRWQHIWESLERTHPMTMDIDTVMALADLGVRINANEILMVLTHPSKVPPQTIEDDPVLTYLVDNMYEVNGEVKKPHVHRMMYQFGRMLPRRMWLLIDRPRLRQQLIERRILPPEPASVSACLATVNYAGPDAGMVEVARRAIEQGARGTQGGIVNAVDSGNVDLARVVLDATDPHVIAQWRGYDTWPSEIVGDMWRLLIGKGLKVTRRAILWFAFRRRNEHIDDDTAVSILRELLDAAKPYKHEILGQSYGMGLSRCDEEDARLLAMVEMILEFGYLPSICDYVHAKECLPKTVKVLEEHLEKNGLSVNDLKGRLP